MINSGLIKDAEAIIKDIGELQETGLIPLDGQFYPVVHYPGITMYPPISEEELFKGYSGPADNLFTVYAHIPFCIKYCSFCHYPVKIGDLFEEKNYYLDILQKEMGIYLNRLGLRAIRTRSILVGGGTPTYLAPDQLKRFLQFFTSGLDLVSCTQFSYDVDPPTLLGPEGKERLKIMRSYGVDRLTIGVQSFDDDVLKKMNRPHSADDAVRAIEESREAGFKINIEFIYGYPGQTIESWIETMEKAVSIGVEEIQLYRIKLIPYGDHTATITKIFANKLNDFVPIEQVFAMKKIALSILYQNGYSEN